MGHRKDDLLISLLNFATHCRALLSHILHILLNEHYGSWKCRRPNVTNLDQEILKIGRGKLQPSWNGQTSASEH